MIKTMLWMDTQISQYKLNIVGGLPPTILIGIREGPNELLFICMFWMQMAFLKHSEFCLGLFLFFKIQPKLIGNPVIVARRAGNI